VKITDITVTPFTIHVDRFRNGVVLKGAEVVQTLTTVHTDEGAVGHYFGGQGHGDQEGLHPESRELIRTRIKAMLVGQDPVDRERIWHWLWGAKVPEHIRGTIDLALWDLAGQVAGRPVYKLLGGCRDRVPAYASTYPSMGTPEEYAQHALACKRQGYTAYKAPYKRP
jgi:L-alanine-DL-glutamate epimerase-like enolase superfamily enzyme